MDDALVNEMQGELERLLGMTFLSLRIITVVYGAVFITLCAYRLYTVIRCLRRPVANFQAPTDRVIYVALAVFVPLGFGAWIFDVVENRKNFPLFFVIPFLVLVACTGVLAIAILPRTTNFEFSWLTK